MKYTVSILAILLIVLTSCENKKDEITVFTRNGCSRCEYTLHFLDENKIAYKELSIEIESNNSKMWDIIEKSGKSEVDHITMPAIVYNEKIYFSISNLEDFLDKIAAE